MIFTPPLTAAWFLFWFIFEALVFTAAIFAGIIVFRVSRDASSASDCLTSSGQMKRCSGKREPAIAGPERLADSRSRFLPTR